MKQLTKDINNTCNIRYYPFFTHSHLTYIVYFTINNLQILCIKGGLIKYNTIKYIHTNFGGFWLLNLFLELGE